MSHLSVRPLHPDFGVEVLDVDASRSLECPVREQLRELFETHSLLLIRGPVLSDQQQLAFSELFGKPQISASGNLTGGSRLSRQSNVDPVSNEIMPADHARMRYQKATRFWHADSSYRQSGSLCSILAAREVPPTGGDTEFASLRVAWRRLPLALRERIQGLVCVHSLAHSQSLTGEEVLSAQQQTEFPTACHPLVQVNPRNGQPALLIGAHASHIEGWPTEQGRALLDELLQRATVADNVYAHRWRAGDILIWDNRCMLHRSTGYESQRYRRWLERATIPLPAAQDA
ncbi:MAG: TauD/TfdA family dioxygenase [Gammaproteobacteria bacterium]|nr:TauD/TfdA family dioxygenase [Gammaproteobacteria bacterium]